MAWLLIRIKTFLAHHMLVIEFCDDCGRRVRHVWHAPDDLWRRFNDTGDYSGVFCIRCFDRRADRAGCVLMWRPEVDSESKPSREAA